MRELGPNQGPISPGGPADGVHFNLSQSYRAGLEWNLLNVGTGLLVGLNVGMSCCSEHSSLPTALVQGSSNPALARKS
jgi:hypothetical protein